MRDHITRRAVVGALIAVVAGLAVAGCGGGSSSSKTASTSNALASSGSGRRAAIQACLSKQGIKPPQRPNGGRGFFGPGGGPGNQRMRDALRKCGISPRFGRRFNSARYKQTIDSFVACVRSHGFNLPAPNFSGKGPVFDPSKVNRSDPKFLAAARQCQGMLRFRRGPAAPQGGGGIAGSA